MSTISPLDAFGEWFESLPISVREDISFLSYIPLQKLLKVDIDTFDSKTRSDAFLDWVINKEESYFTTVGKLLIIRSCIDFFIMQKRGTAEGWDETKRDHELMLEKIPNDPKAPDGIEETVRGMLEKMPFRSKQWIKAAETWKNLCDSNLSDEALHAWMDLQLINRQN